jgi:hypothetical protein
MRCPKCGYISFDSNLECPKCRSDISMEQSKLHLPSFKPSPPFLIGKLVGNQNSFLEDESAEFFIDDMDDSAIRKGDAPEHMEADGDAILEEEFGSEAKEGMQTASDSITPPSYAKNHIEEIKELISELMPAKSRAAPGKKEG